MDWHHSLLVCNCGSPILDWLCARQTNLDKNANDPRSLQMRQVCLTEPFVHDENQSVCHDSAEFVQLALCTVVLLRKGLGLVSSHDIQGTKAIHDIVLSHACSFLFPSQIQRQKATDQTTSARQNEHSRRVQEVQYQKKRLAQRCCRLLYVFVAQARARTRARRQRRMSSTRKCHWSMLSTGLATRTRNRLGKENHLVCMCNVMLFFSQTAITSATTARLDLAARGTQRMGSCLKITRPRRRLAR